MSLNLFVKVQYTFIGNPVGTQTGVDVIEKRKKMGTGWKDATGTMNIEAYIFDTRKFSEDTFKAINAAAQ